VGRDIGPVQPMDERNSLVCRKVGSQGTYPEGTAWGVRRGTVVVHHVVEISLSCHESSMGHSDWVGRH
jgi:hypothetical protein